MSSADDPIYAVIFSAQRASGEDDGYDAAAARMAELSRSMPGFLSMEHARSEDGFGITICYWESEEAIAAWRENAEHKEAQERGKAEWYSNYNVRVARIIRDYGATTSEED